MSVMFGGGPVGGGVWGSPIVGSVDGTELQRV